MLQGIKCLLYDSIANWLQQENVSSAEKNMKIYGDSKFRYDAIADPPGGKWVVLKQYMKDKLEPYER